MAALRRAVCAAAAFTTLASASPVPALYQRQSSDDTVDLSACPGYKASNVVTTSTGMTASLSLAGTACNAYGTDLTDLTLTVEYQTGKQLEARKALCNIDSD